MSLTAVVTCAYCPTSVPVAARGGHDEWLEGEALLENNKDKLCGWLYAKVFVVRKADQPSRSLSAYVTENTVYVCPQCAMAHLPKLLER